MKEYIFKSFLKEDIALFLKKRSSEVVPRTLLNDSRALLSFDRSLDRDGAEEATHEVVSRWIASLTDLSPGTVNRYITTVRAFINYVNALRGKHYFIPGYRTAEKRYIPYYFTEQDEEKIYASVDNYKPTKQNTFPWIAVELPMIVRIMAGCGTRVEELLLLRMKDIDLLNGVIIMRETKGSKQRRVPMSQSLSEILENYCNAMGIIGQSDAYLFPGTSKETSLNVIDVSSNRFRRILERLGIRRKKELQHYERGPCLYNYRHTFAINSFRKLNNAGIVLDDIVCYLSVYMGHENILETQKYLKFSSEIFPEEMEKFYCASDELTPQEDKWEKWKI